MSNQDTWKIEGEKPPQQFWIDYGNFVMASHEFPYNATNDDWQKLIHWAEVLMSRYNNTIANKVVMDYIDIQSYRAVRREEREALSKANMGTGQHRQSDPAEAV